MNQLRVNRDEVVQFLAQTLNITDFRDYCPNGLQVEGRKDISLIVSGVTANIALLEAAIAMRADAILVHHGYFWRGEDQCIVGIKQKRLKLLLEHELNLFAYHLPLDAHSELGNNAQLGKLLELTADSRFGEGKLGWLGHFVAPEIKTVADAACHIESRLGRKPMVIGDLARSIKRIGWCTGAAQNLLPDAIAAGADIYLSGEISEPTVHTAVESGVAYLACGHHATERYGVQAVGELLSRQFGIRHHFIDIANPV